MNDVFIYHHNDQDGRAACAVVLHWLENHDLKRLFNQTKVGIKILEVSYKDALTFDTIGPTDDVFIVDFSFKPNVMKELQDHTSNIVWCDHHATAESYGYDVPGLRDFSPKGLSGCEATWKYLFIDEEIPYWLWLLGDYDAWRLRDEDCFRFYEGLKLQNQSQNEDGIWRKLFKEGNSLVSKIVDEGRTAILYRDNYCQEMRKTFGYETELDGVRAYVLNVYGFGSKGLGEMMELYPLCICYIHDGLQFTVSLYSVSVDVGKIAQKFGGGGHGGAAGFVCSVLPFSPVN